MLANIENDTFTCFRCGICCHKFQVKVNQQEAQIIASKLVLSWDQFLDTCIDHRWPGRESYLIRQVNGACTFLQQDNKRNVATCTIYAFRPSACREWQAGADKIECREGLENMNKTSPSQ